MPVVVAQTHTSSDYLATQYRPAAFAGRVSRAARLCARRELWHAFDGWHLETHYRRAHAPPLRRRYFDKWYGEMCARLDRNLVLSAMLEKRAALALAWRTEAAAALGKRACVLRTFVALRGVAADQRARRRALDNGAARRRAAATLEELETAWPAVRAVFAILFVVASSACRTCMHAVVLRVCAQNATMRCLDARPVVSTMLPNSLCVLHEGEIVLFSAEHVVKTKK